MGLAVRGNHDGRHSMKGKYANGASPRGTPPTRPQRRRPGRRRKWPTKAASCCRSTQRRTCVAQETSVKDTAHTHTHTDTDTDTHTHTHANNHGRQHSVSRAGARRSTAARRPAAALGVTSPAQHNTARVMLRSQTTTGGAYVRAGGGAAALAVVTARAAGATRAAGTSPAHADNTIRNEGQPCEGWKGGRNSHLRSTAACTVGAALAAGSTSTLGVAGPVQSKAKINGLKVKLKWWGE